MRKMMMFVATACLVLMLGAVGFAANITVDGKVDDWASIEPLATATGQNATSLKVTEDDRYLYVLVQGENLNTHSQVFINTDDDITTGYVYPLWGSGGFDFHLSDNTPRRYVGTGGTNWAWETVEGSGVVIFVKTDTAIEVGILKAALAATAPTISIGYVQRDDDWIAVGSPLPNLFPAKYTFQ